MSGRRLPAAPSGLGKAGRRAWRAINEDYELSGADLLVVEQICVEADQAEQLKPLLAMGWFRKDPNTGLPRVNPAYQQHRLLTDSMAKKMASIRIIGNVAEDEQGRPQKRSGFHGFQLRAVE
jgi:hypothetical protein